MDKHVIVLFVVIGFLCVTSFGQTDCNFTHPCPLNGGEYLEQPHQIRSTNGSLILTLTIDVGDFNVDWLKLRRRMYNGSVVGPTWIIRKGDQVKIRLMNDLTMPNPNFGNNHLRFPNSSNLHTHGLHISSEVPSDNAFVHVYPEQEFTYKYSIENLQPSGTYWYHPHLHGSTLLQVHSGMAGLIIVEDEISSLSETLKSASCPLNCEHDVQLLFQPLLLYSNILERYQFSSIQDLIGDLTDDLDRYNVSTGGTLKQWIEDDNNGVDYFTTNGKIKPVLNITTGQLKRFRMVNAGGGPTLELEVVDASSGEPACEIYEIAIDGVYLDEARKQRLNKTLLVPSQRCDWLVMCSRPGTYVLRSNPEPADVASLGPAVRWSGTLLTINVNGPENATAIDTTLPGRPHFISDFRSIPSDEIKGKWILETSPTFGLNRERFTCEERYRYRMEVDVLQEWQILNTSPFVGHPMHLHVNHFQVINFQPYTGPVGAVDIPTLSWKMYGQDNETCFYQHLNYKPNENIPLEPNPLLFSGHYDRWVAGGAGTLGYAEAGEFRDVVWVPPLSNITIRFLPDKFLGTVVVHCHFLNHGDMGMMLTTQIVPQGVDLTAVIASGNAFPGTCNECDTYPFLNTTNPCPNTKPTTDQTNTPGAISSASPMITSTEEVPIATSQTTDGFSTTSSAPYFVVNRLLPIYLLPFVSYMLMMT